jgi:hypothetical protein
VSLWAGPDYPDEEFIRFGVWLDELEYLDCGQVWSLEQTTYDTEVRAMAWEGDEVRLTWGQERRGASVWRLDMEAVAVDLVVAP